MCASRWEREKLFECDAPPAAGPGNDGAAGDGVVGAEGKFFVTFPYPYMNGLLHLGHAFSLTKAEFAVSYQRMMGRRCLWPFGFHCTGMPIQAAADNLRREMQGEMQGGGQAPAGGGAEVGGGGGEDGGVVDGMAGIEVGGVGVEGGQEEGKGDDGEGGGSKAAEGGKFVSNKSKLKDKRGKGSQWSVLESMGIAREEIPKFADAAYWLDYFPPIARDDLKAMGCKVDWRRSFITTDKSRFYDSFVRWQFNKLRKAGKVKFGKRYRSAQMIEGLIACIIGQERPLKG